MSRSEQARFRGLTVPAIALFVTAALAAKAQAAALTVGPVEHVNLKTSTLVVLGQTYHIDRSVLLRNQAGAAIPLDSLTPYTVVSVQGTETAAGKANLKSITALPELDVPGATRLLITGRVASESAAGHIKIGNLTVDITPTMTSDTATAAVGELVQVVGTQPTAGGLFLAQSVVSLGVAGTGSSPVKSFGVAGTGSSSVKSFGVAGTGSSSVTSFGVAGTGSSPAKSFGVAGTGSK